ncbi:putative acyl---UDP-N-acetylglucosamine-O-acyltransferase [Cladorrhinum sp. PSN332]|nr:putative acyl---UDP-N-acetylglucosamine-O-acyltransferase [Cladorrhinum sp. PSN332]
MADQLLIHPTSLIHPSASLSPSVRVGPFCLVGPNVTLGANTTLLSNVTISGRTTVGSNCTIHPYTALGGPSQAIADNNSSDSGSLTIGNNCTIRESVTANLGLSPAGTVIGNNCLILANAHVAHDCIVGDEVILVNGVLLAGHVKVGKGAIIAGGAGVLQFAEVGEYAYVGGKSVVSRDVLPFSMVKGFRARTVGVNVVGLRRRGWGDGRIKRVEKGVGIVLRGDREGLEEEEDGEGDLKRLADFVKGSKRGVCLGRIEGKGVSKI